MPVVLVFLMGVANFALHRAVLAAGHPLMTDAAWFKSKTAGRITLTIEFSVLVLALALAFSETSWAVAAYGIYTIANGVAAWLILSRRL